MPEREELRLVSELRRADGRIPVELTPFVGREAEREALTRLLLGSRLVTVTGLGGAGKTRLTSQVASEAGERFTGGVWWVALESVDGEGAASAVLNALGLRHDHGQPLIERIAGYLGSEPVLLVFDNCEHVVDAIAPVVDALLRASASVSVLATSREPLGVPGEQVWPLPPLSVPPDPRTAGVDAVEKYDAVRLFVDRATRARPDFDLTAELAPVVAEICDRLDGMALGIELAAAQVAYRSPAEVRAGLREPLRMLVGGGRTAPLRHQTLEASIRWSHELLSGDEGVLLRRLAVFAGFDTDAVEAVCSDVSGDRVLLAPTLGQLVAKSLVAVHPGPEATRYRLLDTIRQFASDRLVEADEAGEVRDRHARYFLGRVEELTVWAEMAGKDALEWLDAEHHNIEVALEHLLITDRQASLRLASAVAPYWTLRSRYRTGAAWLSRALETDDRTANWARAAAALARLRLPAMDLAHAFGLNEAVTATEVATEVGDPVAANRGLLHQGLVESLLGAPAGADRLAKVATRAGEIGDHPTRASALGYLAVNLGMFHDEREQAVRCLEALADDIASGNLVADQAHALVRGHLAMRAGELAEAMPHLERSLAICVETGDAAGEVFAADGMGELLLQLGQPAVVRNLMLDSLDRMRRSAPGRTEVIVSQLAAVDLAEGRAADAQAPLEETETAMRQFGGPWFVIRWLLRAARADIETGAPRRALVWACEAVAIGRAQSMPWMTAHALVTEGDAHRAAGETADAERSHHDALAVALERGFRPVAAIALSALGGLAVDTDSPIEASRLLAAGDAAASALGLVRDVPTQARFDADRRAASAAAAGEFNAWWSEGAAMSLDDAVAYARRSRGGRKRPSHGWESLTPTEHQVVALVVEGLTNPALSERLFISLATVKTHLSHVFTKLGVSNRAELTAEAVRREVGS